MATNALAKTRELFPSFFDDFNPWNEWLGNRGLLDRTFTVPAVNITEEKNDYKITMAVPGMKRDDFRVDVAGNIMTISAETEQNKEEENKKYTRKEYNYSSFSRSFTLPDEVNKEGIEAKYADGVLTILLQKKEEMNVQQGKNIVVK